MHYPTRKSSLLATVTLNSQPLRALGDLGTQSGFTLPAGCDIGTSGEDRTKLLHAFTLWLRESSAGTTDGRRFGMRLTPSCPVIRSSERVNRGINTARRSVLRPNLLSQKSKYALKALPVLSQEYGKGPVRWKMCSSEHRQLRRVANLSAFPSEIESSLSMS
jgi:hypothetical protein